MNKYGVTKENAEKLIRETVKRSFEVNRSSTEDALDSIQEFMEDSNE